MFLHGQSFYRVSADFTIKQKMTSGKSQLIIGKVYYDKHIDKLVYDVDFPKTELWISVDSSTYKIVSDTLSSTTKTSQLASFSIFNISLNGSLANYGIDRRDNSFYHIEKVEEDQGMVITTWAPHEKIKEYVGKVIMSQKQKKLFGMVFLDIDESVRSKQFFRNYMNESGFIFPQEIIQIDYFKDGKEQTKITTFENIVVNNLDHDEMYDYPVPAGN